MNCRARDSCDQALELSIPFAKLGRAHAPEAAPPRAIWRVPDRERLSSHGSAIAPLPLVASKFAYGIEDAQRVSQPTE